MRRVIFRRQAWREFDGSGDWYEQECAGLGLEFLAEIERLIQRITSELQQCAAYGNNRIQVTQ